MVGAQRIERGGQSETFVKGISSVCPSQRLSVRECASRLIYGNV